MKKLNFFAVIASIMLLSACGEQRTEDSTYDSAPDATQEAPSDVYGEGEVIEEEATMEEEDGTVDLNIDREGADAGVNTDEVDVNIDTREQEDTVNAVE